MPAAARQAKVPALEQVTAVAPGLRGAEGAGAAGGSGST